MKEQSLVHKTGIRETRQDNWKRSYMKIYKLGMVIYGIFCNSIPTRITLLHDIFSEGNSFQGSVTVCCTVHDTC